MGKERVILSVEVDENYYPIGSDMPKTLWVMTANINGEEYFYNWIVGKNQLDIEVDKFLSNARKAIVAAIKTELDASECCKCKLKG